MPVRAASALLAGAWHGVYIFYAAKERRLRCMLERLCTLRTFTERFGEAAWLEKRAALI